MNDQIEIYFKKRKVLPYVGGSLFFALAGLLILWVVLNFQFQVGFKIFLISLGLISLLFFGSITLILLPKLFIRRAGLIISDEGIWDYSSGLSAGFISWGDIRKISHTFSGPNTFIVLTLKSADRFIAKQSNPIKRIAMRINYRISGYPVHILVSWLDIDFYRLNDLIASKRFSNKKTSNMQM